MKRVLIFSLTYLPFIGGAEVAVEQITKRLAGDYEFDLITLRPNLSYQRFEKLGNVNVYRIGFARNQGIDLAKTTILFKISKLLYPILALNQAIKLFKTNNYSVVWSIMAAYAGLAGLLVKVKFPKTKFILTLQEGDTADHVKSRAGIFSLFLKQIFVKADFIQAISNYLIDFAKSFDCFKPIIVIPNGVDLNTFKRGNNKIVDDKIRLITTSRLVEKNGLADLILSLKYLDKKYIIDILGSGPLQSKLEKLVTDNNLTDRVNFVGSVPQAETVKYLNQADIFIRPSLSEGLGNSFLEAMAVGLPIIGTPVGGIVDFLKDGETGMFCQVSDPQSIATQAEKITNNPELRLKLINNGQNLVTEKYNWDIVARQFKTLIFDKLT